MLLVCNNQFNLLAVLAEDKQPASGSKNNLDTNKVQKQISVNRCVTSTTTNNNNSNITVI